MPHYKLNYFDIRGRAETARLIFHYSGQEFEDRRWSNEEWPEIKSTSETGKAPWLEVDGERIYDSTAINRYLGNVFGLAGKDAMENAQIDSIVDTYKDFSAEARPYFLVKVGRQEGNIEELRPKAEEAMSKWFTYLQKRLDKSGSGYIASKISWGDFYIAEGIQSVQNCEADFVKNFLKILDYKNRFYSQPKIKEYIETRKDSLY